MRRSWQHRLKAQRVAREGVEGRRQCAGWTQRDRDAELTTQHAPTDDHPYRPRLSDVHVQTVDDVLEPKWHLDVEDLSTDEERDGREDPDLDGVVRSRPDVDEQLADDGPV